MRAKVFRVSAGARRCPYSTGDPIRHPRKAYHLTSMMCSLALVCITASRTSMRCQTTKAGRRRACHRYKPPPRPRIALPARAVSWRQSHHMLAMKACKSHEVLARKRRLILIVALQRSTPDLADRPPEPTTPALSIRQSATPERRLIVRSNQCCFFSALFSRPSPFSGQSALR